MTASFAGPFLEPSLRAWPEALATSAAQGGSRGRPPGSRRGSARGGPRGLSRCRSCAPGTSVTSYTHMRGGTSAWVLNTEVVGLRNLQL